MIGQARSCLGLKPNVKLRRGTAPKVVDYTRRDNSEMDKYGALGQA